MLGTTHLVVAGPQWFHAQMARRGRHPVTWTCLCRARHRRSRRADLALFVGQVLATTNDQRLVGALRQHLRQDDLNGPFRWTHRMLRRLGPSLVIWLWDSPLVNRAVVAACWRQHVPSAAPHWTCRCAQRDGAAAVVVRLSRAG